MPPIWTDAYLQRVINDAELDLVLRHVINIYARKSYATTAGVGTVALANDILDIVSVTWKGKKLDPLSYIELEDMEQQYRSSTQSVPKYYARQLDGTYVLRLYPKPNESLTVDDTDLYIGVGIKRRLIVSYWRRPDSSADLFEIPDYVTRRIIKAGVLEEAFRREGKGQNLQAAEYWKNKKELLNGFVSKIMNKKQRAKRRQLGPYGRMGRPKRLSLSDDFVITP